MDSSQPLEYAVQMAAQAQNDFESQVWLWIKKKKKENSRLEFKLRIDLTTPGAKAEFIRDVMALANSEGENPRKDGHLVIGFRDGQHQDIAGEHYDGAKFGELLDSYIFPAVDYEYEEFSHKSRGCIGVLTVKADPLVLHLVNKKLHDREGKPLPSPGQCWGRKSDRKVELSGEAVHERLREIIASRIDAATQPLRKRIKKLEQDSGPAFEVKRIRFEIEATSTWPALEAILQKLIPYAREFDHVVKHEVLNAVMDVTGRTRQEMPVDVAQAVDSVLMEVLPINGGSYHHPAREKFTDDDLGILKRIEHATFELSWDACRYLRDIRIVGVGARLYWVLIRFATLNRLKRLQAESLHNARYCRHICTEERMGKDFPEGHAKLGETIADALDAFECDYKDYSVKLNSPKAVSAADFDACVAIIKTGDAVDWESARAELPLASALAIARKGEEIVGVGAIKRERRRYAAGVATKSGFVFPPETLELGYVAVSPEHRGHHLSHCIVKALLKEYPKRVFATTPSAFMKDTLTNTGFVNKGKEWPGRKEMLSFWDKE